MNGRDLRLQDDTTVVDEALRGAGLTIALVIEELSVGGAERMLVSLANRLQEGGWRVHLVCLRAPGVLAEELHPSIPIHVMNKRRGVDPLLLIRLNRCLRQIQPLVVNSHLWVANTWTRLSLLFNRIPIVVSEHSRDEWKPSLYRLIDRVLAVRTAALVAVSGDTADFYRKKIGLPASLITVINNGINTKRFAAGDGSDLRKQWLAAGHEAADSPPREAILIGTVGRIVPAKNHRRLVDAVAQLQRDPALAAWDIRLILVGDGEDRALVEEHVRQQGLQQRVIFTGSRQDIPDVLAAFDLFVLSSDREGHPLTALEAQAAGTPVVLTDAGGSSEAVAQQGARSGGVVVERSTEALAAALRYMIVSPECRQDRAAFATTFAAANFDQSQMIDRYIDVFLSVSKMTSANTIDEAGV